MKNKKHLIFFLIIIIIVLFSNGFFIIFKYLTQGGQVTMKELDNYNGYQYVYQDMPNPGFYRDNINEKGINYVKISDNVPTKYETIFIDSDIIFSSKDHLIVKLNLNTFEEIRSDAHLNKFIALSLEGINDKYIVSRNYSYDAEFQMALLDINTLEIVKTFQMDGIKFTVNNEYMEFFEFDDLNHKKTDNLYRYYFNDNKLIKIS